MRALPTPATMVALLALAASCDATPSSSPPPLRAPQVVGKPASANPRASLQSVSPAGNIAPAHAMGIAGADPSASTASPPPSSLRVAGGSGGGASFKSLGGGKVGTRGRGAGDGSYGAGALGASSIGTPVVSGKGSGGLGLRGTGMGGGGTGFGYGSGAGGLGISGTGAGGYDRVHPATGGTFASAGVNPTTSTREDPLSTFAIDVDTASWFFARAYLQSGTAPPKESVRVEEWVNAFHYDYAGPADETPFAVHLDGAPSPFDARKQLVRVGVQGRRIDNARRKPANLTFLVDVSGSMQDPDKLPLVRTSLHMLTDALDERDTVSIVTYAGETRIVMPAINAAEKRTIHAAIDSLKQGGGTDMGSGMELAFREAGKRAGSDRISRVVVLSDGDANIGKVSHQQILAAVKGYVSEGVTMSTVGFGRGNYNDALMEQLADAGDGNYTYVDSPDAARRFFVQDLVATLQVVAKDVKIQVEWNPDAVVAYRLVGYENRAVRDVDFANDKVDGGEVGAGHAVTALYEIERAPGASDDARLAVVRVRAKAPHGGASTETAYPLVGARLKRSLQAMDDDGRFAAATAMAAEVLRGSPAAKYLRLDDAIALAATALSGPHAAERRAFVAALQAAPNAAVAQR